MTQERDKWPGVLKTAMNIQVPWNVNNFLTSLAAVSFSRSFRKVRYTVEPLITDTAGEFKFCPL
jgi:hypothetical protein